MTAEHEPCPDCGLVPQGAFRCGGRWFVRCPALGCHNVTRPTDPDKGERGPEDAFRIWDGWARRERLRELRNQRERERGEQATFPMNEAAAPPEDSPPPDAAAWVAVERTACRLCGRPLQWMVAPDGRRMPFDVLEGGGVGANHFQTCKPYLAAQSGRDRP